MNVQYKQLNSSDYIRLKQLTQKKSLTQEENNEFLELFANMARGKDLFDTYNDAENKFKGMVKQQQQTLQLKVTDPNGKETEILATPISETTISWDSEKIKAAANVKQLELQCDADYMKFFRKPTISINPTACMAAGDEFKAKFGTENTTINKVNLIVNK